jgi:integrase
MAVPTELWQFFQKREIKKSLKTQNKRRAEKMAFIYAENCREIFEKLREPKKVTYPFTELKYAKIKVGPNGIVELQGLEMDPRYPEAENAMYNNLLKQHGITQQSAPITDPPPAHVEAAEIKTLATLFSTVIEKFIVAKIVLKPKKKKYYSETVAYQFKVIRFITGDIPVESIDHDKALEIVATLKQLPPNLFRTKAYKDKSVSEILAMNAKPISAATANEILINVSALFRWLVKRNLVRCDYFEDLRLEESGEARDRFSVADLELIFNHPTFTEHQFSKEYHFFGILIALHSGMRQNEIFQLRLKDIIEVDGILCMNVTEEEGETSVKTDAGIRQVPIHPKLLELGFGDYIRSRQDHEWLFENGSRANVFSQWFAAFKKQFIGDCTTKVFHSFRHTVIDDLKQVEANYHSIKGVVGHSDLLPIEYQKKDLTMDGYGKNYGVTIAYRTICHLDYSKELVNVKKWTVGTVPIESIKGRKKKTTPTVTPVIAQSGDSHEPVIVPSGDIHESIFGKSLAAARNH